MSKCRRACEATHLSIIFANNTSLVIPWSPLMHTSPWFSCLPGSEHLGSRMSNEDRETFSVYAKVHPTVQHHHRQVRVDLG